MELKEAMQMAAWIFFGLDNRLCSLSNAETTQSHLQRFASFNSSFVPRPSSRKGGKQMLMREVAFFACAFAFLIGLLGCTMKTHIFRAN